MAFRLKNFRKGSLAYVLLGALLIYEGYGYVHRLSWLERAVTFKDQVGYLIVFAGMVFAAYGIGNLFRRKGDYDDFDVPTGSSGEGLLKAPEDKP